MLQVSDMAFSSDIFLVCICLALIVSICDTAAIRRAKVNAEVQRKKIQIILDCTNETMEQKSFGKSFLMSSEKHHLICAYTLLSVALISFVVLVFKVVQHLRKKIRFFRFSSVEEENMIDQSLQENLSDMENGNLALGPSAASECTEGKHLVNDTKVVTDSPTLPLTPKCVSAVLSEGDCLPKAAFLSGPNAQQELCYVDHTQVFQQVNVNSNHRDEGMIAGDEACRYENLQKPIQMKNPIYELLEDIILPSDTFGYDEEVDSINHIKTIDDFLGIKHLGVMPFY